MILNNISILILISFCFPCILKSQTQYVWKKEGIKIFENPSIESIHIATIPFGQQVNINYNLNKAEQLKVTKDVNESSGLELTSNWCKITVDSLTGYTHSIWLSNLTTPNTKNILKYFENQYERKIDTTRINEFQSNYSISTLISIVEKRTGGCGWDDEITIQNQSFENVFLLCYYFFNLDNSSKSESSESFISSDEYLELRKSSQNEFVFSNWFFNVHVIKQNETIKIHLGGG